MRYLALAAAAWMQRAAAEAAEAQRRRGGHEVADIVRACRPMSFTRPTPRYALRASTSAAMMERCASKTAVSKPKHRSRSTRSFSAAGDNDKHVCVR